MVRRYGCTIKVYIEFLINLIITECKNAKTIESIKSKNHHIFFFQITVNHKKLRTLTLRMYKRFQCKQCCCKVALVVLILKIGLI